MARQALQPYQSIEYSELIRLVGKTIPRKRITRCNTEYAVTIEVDWKDRAAGAVQVRATVEGPSTWNLERQSESLVVSPPDGFSGDGAV